MCSFLSVGTKIVVAYDFHTLCFVPLANSGSCAIKLLSAKHFIGFYVLLFWCDTSEEWNVNQFYSNIQFLCCSEHWPIDVLTIVQKKKKTSNR